jgi:hypothetical protein
MNEINSARFSVILALCLLLAAMVAISPMRASAQAGDARSIQLNPPDLKRGLPFMEALSVKASAQEWSERDLSLRDLSDLLWAANGINRPDVKKYTASSAQNAHDVDIYVFMKDGAYVYDADHHALNPVLDGDHRSELMMTPPSKPAGAPGPGTPGATPPPKPAPSAPPIQIILVSDSTRFRMGAQELRYEWGAIDTGIVSQNISLFCAATGLKTRPRASMDKQKVKKLLNLKDTQYVLLNHPVGYAK